MSEKIQTVINSIENVIDSGEIYRWYCGGGFGDAVIYFCEMDNLSESETEEVKKYFEIED